MSVSGSPLLGNDESLPVEMTLIEYQSIIDEAIEMKALGLDRSPELTAREEIQPSSAKTGRGHAEV